MNLRLSRKWINRGLLIIATGLFSSGAFAQLMGVKTIPGDYATIDAFVTDVNLQGVGAGGVIVDVAVGHTETAPVGGIHLTATGTMANPIIIQKSGSGVNPVISAYAGGTGTPATAVTDGIFSLNGSDYVTIDGIDLTDPNTTNPATMEYGYGMFKLSATDGCQFNTIRNCTVTLSINNNVSGSGANVDGSKGIWLSSSIRATSTTALTVTSAAGSNSNNTIQSNTILNTNIGIAAIGFAASTPFTLADTGNTFGGTSALLGNTISNFGGAASASNPAAGIRTLAQYAFTISYNVLNNNTGSGVNHVNTLRGIYVNTAISASGDINNNSITLVTGATTSLTEGINNVSGSTAASNTININNNALIFGSSTLTSGSINGVVNTGSATTVNINNNNITSNGSPITGTGTFTMITGGSPTTLNINTNSISAIGRTGASGTTRGIQITSPTTANIGGNTIENLAFAFPTSTGIIDGIYSLVSAITVNITNNTIRNFSTPSTGTLTGIRENSVSGAKTISGNEIYGFATTPTGTGGGSMYGIHCTVGDIAITNNKVYQLNSTGGTSPAIYGLWVTGGTTSTVNRNKVYDLSSSGTTPTVAGFNISGNTSNAIYNNVISDLRAPNASATNPLIGINVTGGTASALYFNSVYLNAVAGGTNFGSSAVSVATGTNVTLRNNIFINESVANGTGLAVAYRRSSTTLTSYQAVSNRNLFYAGVPSASRLIMYDGTNSYQTLAAYQTAMVTRDLNSITGEAFTYATPGSFFTSLTGSSADFLKPVAAIVTQTESGAVNITSPLITLDHSSVIRAGNAGYSGTGTNPDMGAYEFEGTTPAPVITLNSVTPPATAACVAAARVVSVNISTASGTVTGANLAYSYNGTVQTPIAMTNTAGTTWEATIPVATPVNASVTWGITATNSLSLTSTYVGATYADEPLTGATASATASNTTVCSGTSSSLSAVLIRPGSAVVVGNGTLTTGTTEELTSFCNRRASYKQQTIYTAADLSAAGLSAGPITSIGYRIISVGSGTSTSNFSVSIGTTALSALTDYVSSTGFTVCRPAATYNHVVGLNTIPFSTSFVWDGTSNIIVEVNHSGADALYNAETVYTTTGSNTVAFGYNASATGTPSNKRFNTTFVGNASAAITSVTWMDGPTTVGTGNPLTVNPTATTTYTANITSSGCVFSPAPTVTVNTTVLPSTPTRMNSAQCGTQVPTATVTSTSGLPTPTFKWYDMMTGGTVMQSDVSTTYLSNVATTTTFYVSELNTSTGCESARVAVTVTVALADGILASTSAATICIGNQVTLTATNTNGTPNQTYTYTWTNAETGSGLTSVTSASTSVTPTLPGTYTYDLTGVDGACSAVSSVSVTVNPFVATVAAINVSCNGYNNGSFSVASSTCGTAPYSYSVDGGLYVTTIPTNLTTGAHNVVIRDANSYESALLSFTITEPSLVISTPTTTNVAVCVGGTSAMVSGTSSTNQSAPQTLSLPLNIAAQPVEVNSAPGNVVTTVTVPALPAGAVVTGVTINVNGLIPNGGTYQSEARLGLSGLFTNAAAAGTGTIGFGTVAGTAFNYTRTITPVGFPITGGALNLLYWESSNDVIGGDDCTFPIGSSVGSIVINYTTPVLATLSWWTAPTGGSQIGTSSPFEVVGTSALASTSTAGVYTVYAQGENSGCASLSRAAATVTVNSPSTSTTAVTNCGPYMWNGISRPTTGTYTFTTTNSVGCDSVATLNLTVNSPSTSTTAVTNCGPYMWNGISRTASGTYTFVTLNAAGCDSTATLNLTVNNATASTTTIVECSPYTWTDGMLYSSTGIYTQTLMNAAGCDSIATLDFTLAIPTSSTTTITECDSYQWTNGTTYTMSGIYTQLLTNANGCDSTATLDLTINISTTGSETVTECSTYTWPTNSIAYTNSGIYTAVLTNAAGCDSTVTLDLTITQPTTGVESASACSSYTWTANNMTYTTAGSYTATLTNAAGCDSIVTLTLTITGLTATATNNGDATVTASAGTSYVWINCATNAAIAGATAQTFAPTVNGSYAVVVTNAAGCSDTSSCVTIGNVGVKEIAGEGVSIFPNPTASDVVINFTSNSASIEVMDAQGKVLATSTILSGDKVTLGEYNRGVYYIRLQTENGTSIHKVVKN